jgi:hypothetical protein
VYHRKHLACQALSFLTFSFSSAFLLFMPLRETARISKPRPTYPDDHRAAMQVPKGGSSCATCKYVSKDLKHCANKHFIAWFGTPDLPFPADQYCSDWFEPAKGTLE